MVKDGKLGVGVIGLGFMGRTHIAAYANCPECDLVAVADSNVERHGGMPPEGGNLDVDDVEMIFDPSLVSVFESGKDLIQHPGVDIVSITTPTPTHVDLVLFAINHGRHVIIEKPVSIYRSEILALSKEARSAGVLVMPAYCMRFWPAWVWTKRAIAFFQFGKVLSASFFRAGATPTWNNNFYLDDAQSGGAIIDLHIHDVDFILHLFGMPDAVSSTGSRKYVSTEYDFGVSGPKVIAEGGWHDDPDLPFSMKFTIECERATIDFELGRSPEIRVVYPNGTCVDYPEASENGNGYDGEISAMVNAIQLDKKQPPVTLEEAALGMSIVDAEIRSLHLKGRVKL